METTLANHYARQTIEGAQRAKDGRILVTQGQYDLIKKEIGEFAPPMTIIGDDQIVVTQDDKTLAAMKAMAAKQIEAAVQKTVALNILEDQAAMMNAKKTGPYAWYKSARFADVSLRAVAQALQPDPRTLH